MDETENKSTSTEETTEETTENKTYSADEVQKMIQAEADRRTNQALKKQAATYEKKLSLSGLDEQQRKEKESAMKIEELQNQLAEFQIEKNKSELKSVLSNRGLSAEFADLISISDNLEESQGKIDKLDALFKAAVKSEVEKRLGSNPPKSNNPKELTEKDIKKMSLAEMQQLSETNPELFKKYFS